ncbi:MAG: GHKL domain-containing protein [Lachnospiraceae bacterium]|nr:GHKL domain-containing protein [Lachnospiraceae bacterium]
MEHIVKFALNLFDLGIFWYYMGTFIQKKRVPQFLPVGAAMVLAFGWAILNRLQHPFINLLTLIVILFAMTLFFQGKQWSRVILLAIFIGVGFLMEPLGLLLLHLLNYEATLSSDLYKYYFVVALAEFMRGNIMYIVCKIYKAKNLKLSHLPREILSVTLLIPILMVVNASFLIAIAFEHVTIKSLILCITIIISSVLTYYFMIYMVERYSYLLNKRYEDKHYREEMQYKEEYYSELEKRNEYVKNLKHNLKNRVSGWHFLLEQEDIEGLKQQLTVLCKELEEIDNQIYCENPIVNSVLRLKLGIAKAEQIKKDISIRIPKKMQLDYGDIGVLYGNLLDNAIEACRKLEPDKRFIKLENKYIDGKLLLIIQNSKLPQKNEVLETTKKDKDLHGRGIFSVRKVVEAYNGTADFQDQGDVFEVAVMLYGIEMLE